MKPQIVRPPEATRLRMARVPTIVGTTAVRRSKRCHHPGHAASSTRRLTCDFDSARSLTHADKAVDVTQRPRWARIFTMALPDP